MHRNEWTHVGAIKSRSSLPQSARSLHQLYICRWQFGINLAAGSQIGFEFRAKYSWSNWLCAHQSCRHSAHYSAKVSICQVVRHIDQTLKLNFSSFLQSSNHSWPNSVQIEHIRWSIRSIRYLFTNAHPGIASTPRHSSRFGGCVQQLQFVSCQIHQLGRNHHR